MASPEVERSPLTSPTNHQARGYPKSNLSSSGEKRKTLNFRYVIPISIDGISPFYLVIYQIQHTYVLKYVVNMQQKLEDAKREKERFFFLILIW